MQPVLAIQVIFRMSQVSVISYQAIDGISVLDGRMEMSDV
jgi:hypothetical protein